MQILGALFIENLESNVQVYQPKANSYHIMPPVIILVVDVLDELIGVTAHDYGFYLRYQMSNYYDYHTEKDSPSAAKTGFFCDLLC